MRKFAIYAEKIVIWSRRPRASPRDAFFFLRQLSFLLSSDIPLIECLTTLETQATPKFRTILNSLIENISEGKTLGESLRQFPQIWSPYVASSVGAAEQSGSLSESLANIADELNRKATLRKKVIGALLYPCIIAVAAAVLTIALTAYIFPKILPILGSLGGTLPLPTRIVLGVSTYIRTWGVPTIFVAGIAIVLIVIFIRSKEKYMLYADKAIFRLPLFGPLLRDYHVSSLYRTLASLLSSGMTLPEALVCTQQSESSRSYRTVIMELKTAIERGENLTRTLEMHRNLFPDIAIQLISTGEASGRLIQACVAIAEFHSHEATERMQTISALVEPVLMITLGLVVGLVAVSIIEPIYAITGHLHTH
jgi:type II secretory pathway component PulF